jgi:hypothetical protein
MRISGAVDPSMASAMIAALLSKIEYFFSVTHARRSGASEFFTNDEFAIAVIAEPTIEDFDDLDCAIVQTEPARNRQSMNFFGIHLDTPALPPPYAIC